MEIYAKEITQRINHMPDIHYSIYNGKTWKLSTCQQHKEFANFLSNEIEQ